MSYLAAQARKRKMGSGASQDLLAVPTPDMQGSGDTIATAQDQPFAPDKNNPMRASNPMSAAGSFQSFLQEKGETPAGGSKRRKTLRSEFMAGL